MKVGLNTMVGIKNKHFAWFTCPNWDQRHELFGISKRLPKLRKYSCSVCRKALCDICLSVTDEDILKLFGDGRKAFTPKLNFKCDECLNKGAQTK